MAGAYPLWDFSGGSWIIKHLRGRYVCQSLAWEVTQEQPLFMFGFGGHTMGAQEFFLA